MGGYGEENAYMAVLCKAFRKALRNGHLKIAYKIGLAIQSRGWHQRLILTKSGGVEALYLPD